MIFQDKGGRVFIPPKCKGSGSVTLKGMFDDQGGGGSPKSDFPWQRGEGGVLIPPKCNESGGVTLKVMFDDQGGGGSPKK